MNKATSVVAITGPAGSGKSTIASKLAGQINQCVNIDADQVKHMIVNGFIYGNEAKGRPQWQLLGTNIGLLAKNFQDAGYNVIINGYLNEPAWENIQKYIVLDHKVLLLPHIDTVMRRDVGRPEEYRMGAKAIQEHYDYFSTSGFYNDFIKLDSTEHSVEETIRKIKELINA